MFELSLMCPEDRIEAVSDALDALDALSVSVEDADAQTDAEQALFGEPGMPPPKEGWQRSRVVALFETEAAASEAQQLLAVQDFFTGCKVLGLAQVPEQDWVRLTQSQFAPVDITPDFWIVPTWHELPAQALRSIRLDPGLAFGTGTHPTTRMCLRWIARHGATSAAAGNPLGRVLDYGCGSGILAISSAPPISMPWTLIQPPSNPRCRMPWPTACRCGQACRTRPRGSTRRCWPTFLPLR
jgi:ribosomal protein L11 methyltransferase